MAEVEIFAKTISNEALRMPEAITVRPFNLRSRIDREAIHTLDVKSLYAENPYPGKAGSHEPMTEEEYRWWVKGSENHNLLAICTVDPKTGKEVPAGFFYSYRGYSDTDAREPYLRAMAELPKDVQIFEGNFDMPGRSIKEYIKGAESGSLLALREFFAGEEGDKKAIVFYAEPDDMADDGVILPRLGAAIIGELNYQHPERIGGKRDTVFLITKESFLEATHATELWVGEGSAS